MDFLTELKKEEALKICKSLKFVSGGQTGTDIAAIDFAIENDLDWGGWIPKDRRNDESGIPTSYTRFKECEKYNYRKRTKLNVIDSDGTLMILPFDREMGSGSLLTVKYAKQLMKPYLTVNPYDDPSIVTSWIKKNNINVLNVAGARERYTIGIYEATKGFLYKVCCFKKDS